MTNSSNPKDLRTTEINKEYAYWQFRLTYTLIIGYAAFYIVRQNLTIAAPLMYKELGWTKSQFGWAFSGFSLLYGLFKFVSGALCDRSSARYFMPIGLLGAAFCSILMGSTTSPFIFGSIFALSACFQSMGWPSVSRSLTQWFEPKALGTRWGIVNASHQIGSVVILMGGAWLVMHYHWRSVFYIPAFICIVLSFWIWNRLRDNPESMGLPSVEEKEGLGPKMVRPEFGPQEKISFKSMFFHHILPNRVLWFICLGTFCVYVVRQGFFFWAPTMIQEMKGGTLLNAGFKTSVLEVMGLVAGIITGSCSGRLFKGRRGISSAICMLGLALSILVYYYLPHDYSLITASYLPTGTPAGIIAFFEGASSLDTLIWGFIGFFVYGAQTLTGLSGAESGSKKVAAAATGLTGTVGYLGAALAGIGVGKLSEFASWYGVLTGFVVCSLLGGLCFLAAEWEIEKRKQRALAGNIPLPKVSEKTPHVSGQDDSEMKNGSSR